jgi:hypothetical protein
MLDLLLDDPVGHRVDVETDHVAANAVRFQQWRASPHERVGDLDSWEVIRPVKRLPQRAIRELG